MPQRTPEDGARPERSHDNPGRLSQELVDKPIGSVPGDSISINGIWNGVHGKAWKENEELLEAYEKSLLNCH